MIRKTLFAFLVLALLAIAAFAHLASRAAPGDSAAVYAAYMDGKLPVREIKYGPPHPIFYSNRTTAPQRGALQDWLVVRKRLTGLSPVAFANMIVRGRSAHPVSITDPRFQGIDPGQGSEAVRRLRSQNTLGFH